jgi:tetratricopeptide (TPR) repeat protein
VRSGPPPVSKLFELGIFVEPEMVSLLTVYLLTLDSAKPRANYPHHTIERRGRIVCRAQEGCFKHFQILIMNYVNNDQKINEFHQWFGKYFEAHFSNLASAGADSGVELAAYEETAFVELAGRLADIHPALSCEVGVAETGIYTFYLSPSGAYEVIPLVQRVVELSPAADGYELVAFKPPQVVDTEGVSIRLSNGSVATVNEGEVFFTLFPGPLRVDIIAHFEGVKDDNLFRYGEITDCLIERTLGEFEVMVGVGHVHVGDMESLTDATVSLRGLYGAFTGAKEDTLRFIEAIEQMDSSERYERIVEQYGEVFAPYESAVMHEWDLSVEFWGEFTQEDIETIFKPLLSDMVVDLRQEVSLVGQGCYAVLVGTMVGNDVVRNTQDLLKVAIMNGLLPIGLGIDMVPDGEDARLQAGQYLMVGEIGLSVRYYRLALKLEAEGEENGQLQFLAGIAHQLAGFEEEAKELFDEALSLADSPLLKMDIHQNYGSLLHAKGDHRGALDHMLEALEIDRESGIKLFNVANCYCLLGELDNAVRYLGQAFNSDQRQDILEHVMVDGDFAELRKTAEFKRLLGEVSGCN